MKSGGLHGWQELWIKHLKFCAGDTQVQITSLTDFSSKLAHVYVIKVSFLLENKNKSGEPVKGRTDGRGGATKSKLVCQGAASPAGTWVGRWGSSHPHLLCLPQTWVAVKSPPRTAARPWGLQPPAWWLCPQARELSLTEALTLLLTSADALSQTDQWN